MLVRIRMNVRMTAENTVQGILEYWKKVGVPEYVQFDNGTVFHGPNNPDSIGNVSKLCFSLGVFPIFVPTRAGTWLLN
jgi:hypothetical protein